MTFSSVKMAGNGSELVLEILRYLRFQSALVPEYTLGCFVLTASAALWTQIGVLAPLTAIVAPGSTEGH